MKIRWEFDGKQYVISGHRNGKMYLNKHPFDCTEILKGLESNDAHEVYLAKVKAKRLHDALIERHDHGEMWGVWYTGDPELGIEGSRDKYRMDERPDWYNSFKEDWPVWIIGILMVLVAIYILYQLWWFFIGKSAFEGPFADLYTAEETFADTIIFFIILIVVIEEVIRRIINGHF